MTEKEIIETLKSMINLQKEIIHDQSSLLKEFKSYISILSRAPMIANNSAPSVHSFVDKTGEILTGEH